MSDIPDFADALEAFRQFLSRESLPPRIQWVFRNDTWMITYKTLVVRRNPDPQNAARAAKVYAEGRSKGLVTIDAIGRSRSHTFATVWFPKFASDEVQGWDRGLKLTIRQPCPVAWLVWAAAWPLLKWSPAFRRYQRRYTSIGAAEWADA